MRGRGEGHDADAGVRDCPWGGGGDGKFGQAMNSPWPQKCVNGPAVLAVVAWLGRTELRSRSEGCCLLLFVVVCCCLLMFGATYC